jgi:hypothetical protein
MGISGIYGTIFLKKIPWNWSMDLYTESTVLRSSSLQRSLNADRSRCDMRPILIQTNRYRIFESQSFIGKRMAHGTPVSVGSAHGSER